ncbi:MAG: hypothetical protein JZD41_07315 [Thermoproteus sp.]|nr:hypothetical protein [Thermoproteus sp.]
MIDPLCYFILRGCNYWHEYPSTYGKFDIWRDATVVAIGADCGSTFVYLASLGAGRFVGYEREEKLRLLWENEVCRQFGLCERAEMRGEWRGEPLPKGDVLIVDCEGCEVYLRPEHLAGFKYAFIAVHSWIPADEKKRLVETLLANAKRIHTTPDSKEDMYFIAV